MKSRKIVFAYVAFLFMIPFLSCSQGQNIVGCGIVSKQLRTVTAFSKIAVSDAFDLEMTQGDKNTLSIEADTNLFKYITTVISGDTLRIKIKKGSSVTTTKPIKVYLTFKEISALEFSGAVNLKGMNRFKLPKLDIGLSGAGELNFSITTETMNMNLSGSSEIKVTGTCTNADYDISGVGNLEALNLIMENCTIDISGAGNAKVTANNQLNVTMSGAGNLEYKGNPWVNKTISGAGVIKKLD